jgi:hypothetical protein
VGLIAVKAHPVVDMAALFTGKVDTHPFVTLHLLALELASLVARVTAALPVKAFRNVTLSELSTSLVA